MMDTSALVAALIEDHEHHALSRPTSSRDVRLPAIVFAETFAQLRRTFGQSAATATAVAEPVGRRVGARSCRPRRRPSRPCSPAPSSSISAATSTTP